MLGKKSGGPRVKRTISLDHVGHFVVDPIAASRDLRELGFVTTPFEAHRNSDGSLTGTGNVCAMLEHGYLEVLGRTADTQLGLELAAAVSDRQGVHLLAFEASNAAAEHERLETSGFSTRPLVDLRRPTMVDGEERVAAFVVARVESGQMAEGRIQFVTHLSPELVWRPELTRQPNGVRSLCSALILSDDVPGTLDRYARFLGVPPTGSSHVDLTRGRLVFCEARRFRDAIGHEVGPAGSIAAYHLKVASLRDAALLAQSAGLRVVELAKALLCPFPASLGVGHWILTEGSTFDIETFV